ncbi:hypothetical protein [Lichenicoccus sp.]|uniref:hypothetical protein n=1 Tax=Lichenicoccus sp. TaxID=2781899 RepID=UPI003D0BE4F6
MTVNITKVLADWDKQRLDIDQEHKRLQVSIWAITFQLLGLVVASFAAGALWARLFW